MRSFTLKLNSVFERRSRFCVFRPAALTAFSVLLFSWPLVRAAKQPGLQPIYAHWLNEEVNYLITSDERNLFLSLKSDQNRDKFIETFWQARNPNPTAPTNVFKEEHYRRLEYANAQFGAPNLHNGWRSDRGMVYITLGAPQQREVHREPKYLQPLEIWFYENASPAIPPHFYVVFYKPSPAQDYRLYSPYGDRPQKLIASTNAINDDATAVRIIQNDLGEEAARISLSLIPGEPVDLKDPSPSLQSDVLLGNIRNFRNLPANRDLLDERRALLEGVSHRLVLGEQFSYLLLIATRDGERHASIHYLMRLLHPEDFSMAEQTDGRYFYSLAVEVEVVDPGGKVVDRKAREMSDYVRRQEFAENQGKCLAVEGRLPAEPGKYEVRVTLTNRVTKQAFRQSKSVLVPDFGDRLGISEVFFASPSAPVRDLTGDEPFSVSGVKIAPIGSDNAVITQGDPLRVMMQLWESPASPLSLQGKRLELHYLVGKLNTQDRREEDQTVDRGTFDPNGNLLLGRDLRTDTLFPGSYRLVVRVTDPESRVTAYQSLNFEVADPARGNPPLWSLTVPN
jgi:GWxTD domain-containing protein